MFQKIKLYYHNSPKRIGLTWLAIHLLFLSIGLFCVQQADGRIPFSSGTLGLVILMITFFPLTPFMNLDPTLFPSLTTSGLPILSLIVYYGLFVFLLYFARQTGRRSFKAVLIVFSLLFVIH